MTNPEQWLEENAARVEQQFARLLADTHDDDLAHMLMLLANLSTSLLCRYYVRLAYTAVINGDDPQSTVSALCQVLEHLTNAHFDAALQDLDEAIFKHVQPVTRTLQ